MIKKSIISLLHSINRKLLKPTWKDFRSLKPISEVFGADRGKPIDRYYIEKFLCFNKKYINGDVLEIGESKYSKMFTKNIKKRLVLHYSNNVPEVDYIGDLSRLETLPEKITDCFICTQTLNFIYNVKDAIKGIHHLLKENGTALITIAGISQISRYDMDRWGDYWRFTTKSAFKLFSEIFGEQNVVVKTNGNVLTTTAFIQGLASEELTKEELDYVDGNYQLLITIVAKKEKTE